MRKAFSLVIALVVVCVGYACSPDEDASPIATPSATAATGESPTAASSGDLVSAAEAAPSCGFTPSSTEGPFYVSGTQALEDGELNYDDLQGTPIKVAGIVYASDKNADPVQGVKIEIWQADTDGTYHPENNGPASNYPTDEISLRGYVTSDSDGYYEFTSILPGEYEGRTRHIHVRASGDGVNDLISQIITYQQGDRFPPTNDMIASRFPECNLVDFTDRISMKTAVFNFHLQPR